ncbi:hypothetical protein EYF80_016251 [Liparis tanakae]|uniref:Uncharacterized protein n=1 Tax=Liparis tanakae TaxID=230148 RepID=A0A4Z2I6S9_9TELE|nr:hypothetical protein EYF80_016251 [Liparis tanakae]
MALSWESVSTHSRSSRMNSSLEASTCQSSKEAWKARACTLMVMELIRTDMPSTTFSAKPYSLWDTGRERGLKGDVRRGGDAARSDQRRMRGQSTGCMQAYLWPAVIAMGEGPLGARGSSHVLISTSTLSKNCTGNKKPSHTREGG